MPVLKIAEYRLAQDPHGGFVLFSLVNPDGSITEWLGGKWIPVPFNQLSSMIGILTTGNAFFDTERKAFLVSGRVRMEATNATLTTLETMPFKSHAVMKKPIDLTAILPTASVAKKKKSPSLKNLKSKK